MSLCLYFEDMRKRLYRVDKDFYLCPDMAQWGYFLNVDGAMLSGVGFADLWDTAARGIDIYRLAEYVDCTHFISVPVTPAGHADAYVTACHHSMMRSMNQGRDFIGGIYRAGFSTMISMRCSRPVRLWRLLWRPEQRDIRLTVCAAWTTEGCSIGWRNGSMILLDVQMSGQRQ